MCEHSVSVQTGTPELRCSPSELFWKNTRRPENTPACRSCASFDFWQLVSPCRPVGGEPGLSISVLHTMDAGVGKFLLQNHLLKQHMMKMQFHFNWHLLTSVAFTTVIIRLPLLLSDLPVWAHFLWVCFHICCY